jgi:hypothetical protein
MVMTENGEFVRRHAKLLLCRLSRVFRAGLVLPGLIRNLYLLENSGFRVKPGMTHERPGMTQPPV